MGGVGAGEEAAAADVRRCGGRPAAPRYRLCAARAAQLRRRAGAPGRVGGGS